MGTLLMPTVFRAEGFMFRIHGPPREHPPPHVHVHRRPGGEVVVQLPTATLGVVVWWYEGFTEREARRAAELVQRHHVTLQNYRERLHARPNVD